MAAYNEIYLNDAMSNLGEALDYAVNGCGLEMYLILELFSVSSISEQFGKGNPKYVSGMSGTELVHEILMEANYQIAMPDAVVEYEASPEYWCGWILAYYQWQSGMSFRKILAAVKADTLLRMYVTLHEAPEEKALETLDDIMNRGNEIRRLQQLRRVYGYSQSMLAKRSGVNIRTLQQYESGAKDINKASASTLKTLADTMGVGMEDLMEPGNRN